MRTCVVRCAAHRSWPLCAPDLEQSTTLRYPSTCQSCCCNVSRYVWLNCRYVRVLLHAMLCLLPGWSHERVHVWTHVWLQVHGCSTHQTEECQRHWGSCLLPLLLLLLLLMMMMMIMIRCRMSDVLTGSTPTFPLWLSVSSVMLVFSSHSCFYGVHRSSVLFLVLYSSACTLLRLQLIALFQ